MHAIQQHHSFNVMGLLTQPNTRWKVSEYKEKQIVYAQGDPANSIFYVHTGQVKVTVISNLGEGSYRSNPRTTRILRRRSNEWCAAAFGFSHYNVAMRDYTARDANHCSAAS